MAVEIATAYVSLTVSAKGIKRSIEDEIGEPLQKSARDSGDKAGKGFGREFSDNAKDGIGKAGIGLGLLLTKGFVDNLSIEKGNDKLAGQLGLVGAQAKEAGKAAGDLYAGAYGDSLGQVNDAIQGVQQNIDGFRGASAKDLEAVTAKVLSVASAFDQDLGGVTAAVGQLMRTGLAKNADEALDVITKGFQAGADKAGDLLDTFGEYGTQFRKLGLDAKTATGILSQGLKAGARDADIVADALKEFSIRAVDGSEATAAGFAQVGLSAAEMARSVGGGGPSAANALQVTLDRLRAIKDPVAQAAAATALFGTQAEDLGAALFAIDPSTAVTGLGEVAGAASALDKQLSGNTATTLETFKRRFELAFAEFGDKLGPVLSIAPALGGLAQVTDTLGPAMKRAGAGVKGLVGEVGLLKATLAGGAITGALALVAFGFTEWAKAGSRADAVTADLTKDLKTNDLASYATALTLVTLKNRELGESAAGKELGTGFLSGLKEVSGFLPFVSNDLIDTRRAMDGTAKSAAALRDAQGRLNNNLFYFREVLHLADADVLRLANSAGVDLSKALDTNMVVALQKAQGAATSATVKSNDLADAQGQLASKVTTAAEKLDAFKLALDSALGPQIGAYEATTRLAAANANLATAYAEAKGTADLNTEAGRALRDAFASQVQAIGDQITAMIESGQVSTDATEQTNEYVRRLEELRQKYPALSGNIDEFIAKLRTIPPGQTTTITVDTAQAQANVDALRSAIVADFGDIPAAALRAVIVSDFGSLPGRAAGGPVTAGSPYIVGERRRELFVPRTSGRILPDVPPTAGSSFPIHVDARGMQRPEEVGDIVARHVAWRLAVAGAR